ncbi:GIY-YIG nuclease family protein [bacterium]|nr:GIY-YIG nuclease family protein [bacterium]
MFYVYVLWSYKLQKRYTGSTNDITKRLKEHNHGKTPFTKSGIPWALVYHEEYKTNKEAREREKFLKTGIGRKWLDENMRRV